MAKPGMVSVAIFNFLGLWNQFLLPIALNTDQDNYVLSQGMSRFASQAGYSVDFGSLFAAVDHHGAAGARDVHHLPTPAARFGLPGHAEVAGCPPARVRDHAPSSPRSNCRPRRSGRSIRCRCSGRSSGSPTSPATCPPISPHALGPAPRRRCSRTSRRTTTTASSRPDRTASPCSRTTRFGRRWPSTSAGACSRSSIDGPTASCCTSTRSSQPANLALRNAWISGGVEWNIGTRGHSPTTMDTLHAASVDGPDGDADAAALGVRTSARRRVPGRPVAAGVGTRAAVLDTNRQPQRRADPDVLVDERGDRRRAGHAGARSRDACVPDRVPEPPARRGRARRRQGRHQLPGASRRGGRLLLRHRSGAATVDRRGRRGRVWRRPRVDAGAAWSEAVRLGERDRRSAMAGMALART